MAFDFLLFENSITLLYLKSYHYCTARRNHSILESARLFPGILNDNGSLPQDHSYF